METTKVFIGDQKDTANINCPSCQKITEVSTTAFGLKRHLKVKCTCNNVFLVEVEFRDKSRKLVDLPGSYIITADQQDQQMERASAHQQDNQLDREKHNCQIIDLSRIGIGFIALDKQDVKVGDFVELSFKLDNDTKSEINQICQVRHINDNFVGGEILQENTTLGFYLLT